MDITEVRIKLMEDPHDRLQAFCSVTFDSCFVIRDLKIIQGTKGSFVAMPSRKLTDRCPRCHCKNHLRALHCNQCGADLDEERATKDNDGRAKLYADIAHPINSDCRELIQSEVLKAYQEEMVRAKEPHYVCSYDDYGEDRFATLRDPQDVPQEQEAMEPEPAVQEPAQPQPVIATSHIDDVTHRVEPAASHSGPPQPHHGINTPSRQGAIAGDGAAHRSPVSENDAFGAGLD